MKATGEPHYVKIILCFMLYDFSFSDPCKLRTIVFTALTYPDIVQSLIWQVVLSKDLPIRIGKEVLTYHHFAIRTGVANVTIFLLHTVFRLGIAYYKEQNLGFNGEFRQLIMIEVLVVFSTSSIFNTSLLLRQRLFFLIDWIQVHSLGNIWVQIIPPSSLISRIGILLR